MARRKGETERHLAQLEKDGDVQAARDIRDSNLATFLGRSNEDIGLVYDSLIKSVLGQRIQTLKGEMDIPGDPRAMKIFFEYALGKPKEEQGGLIMDAFRAVLEKATETRSATVSERYVDLE